MPVFAPFTTEQYEFAVKAGLIPAARTAGDLEMRRIFLMAHGKSGLNSCTRPRFRSLFNAQPPGPPLFPSCVPFPVVVN